MTGAMFQYTLSKSGDQSYHESLAKKTQKEQYSNEVLFKKCETHNGMFCDQKSGEFDAPMYPLKK